MKKILYYTRTLLLTCFFITSLMAQSDLKEVKVKVKELEQVQQNLNWLAQEIRRNENLLKRKNHNVDKEQLHKNLRNLKEKDRNLKGQFIEQASGLSLDFGIQEHKVKNRDLRKDVQEILTPLIDGLRRISERPRRIEELNTQIKRLNEGLAGFAAAQNNISKLKNSNDFKKVHPLIIKSLKTLDRRSRELQLEIDTKENELQKLKGQKQSMFEAGKNILSTFFKTKGKNLLFSLLGLIFIYWALMKMRRHVFKTTFFKKHLHNVNKPLSALYNMASITISVLGSILILYILNDWLLFTIFIMLIMGILWSLKTVVPQFLQEARLIFNLGAVKEGERIIFQNIPWKVQHLNFLSTLINPSLEGGEIKVAAKELVRMYSRRIGPNERWFPTKKGDWIRYNNGHLCQVISQSPDQVILKKIGGTTHTVTTQQFINQCFENLAEGFRIEITVGLDYNIQNNILIDTIKIFREKLNKKIKNDLENSAHLKKLQVMFKEAATSSLNLWIALECDGKLAPNYDLLKRKINSYFVEICNEEKLDIPFAQMTLSVRDNFWQNAP